MKKETRDKDWYIFTIIFFFSIITIYKLETKNKQKTYNGAPISMLCDVNSGNQMLKIQNII